MSALLSEKLSGIKLFGDAQALSGEHLTTQSLRFNISYFRCSAYRSKRRDQDLVVKKSSEIGQNSCLQLFFRHSVAKNLSI